MATKAELEAQVAELTAKLAEKKEEVEIAPTEAPAPLNVSTFPVPSEWTENVHAVLNKKFTVEVDYNSDTPTFGFSILVPREYSNASKNHWEMYGEDRRTRVINNADGVGGVKQWVEKVYNNFDNETRAKITSDRNAEHG